MTDTLDRRYTNVPTWLIVQEMDRAIHAADENRRIHDTLAAELGFERVRINQVDPGDRIASSRTGDFYEVKDIQLRVDRDGIVSWLFVTFTDANGSCEYDDGQLVSRQIAFDASQEPF